MGGVKGQIMDGVTNNDTVVGGVKCEVMGGATVFTFSQNLILIISIKKQGGGQE